MAIDIYDGNNVMRRAMDKNVLPGSARISLRQRFEQTCDATSLQIWVWDGYDHNARRKDIYPGYKANRTPTPEDIFSQIKLWKEVLRHTPATQVEVSGWEADDVIGTLVRQLQRTNQPIRVHTNDMDYGQIADLWGVQLVGVNMKGVPGRWIALYKAMCGDSSDRIGGIPGFGPKRWLEMEGHWAQIERAIVAGKPEGFVGLPFKPAVAAWLAVQENVDLLQKMLLITHFENVPDDEIDGGIIPGKLDRAAGHQLLARYFL